MADPFAFAYLLIRMGWGGLVIFGVLLLAGLALAVTLGGGQIKSTEFALCGAGLLAALALLSAGAAMEGVLTGEAYFVLRKGGGLVKHSEKPGWYWSSVVSLGFLAAGFVSASLIVVWRTLNPTTKNASHET